MIRVFGSGPPLVIMPGLDGHWTWMRPAIDALARHFTVIPMSLYGEPDSGSRFDAKAAFDVHVAHVEQTLREAGLANAIICGVSYSGWIAVSYAARYPERTSALVLVSAPPPGFQPSAQQAQYLGAPILSMPAFMLDARRRVLPEVIAALPTWSERTRFLTAHGLRFLRTGMSPTRMAWRMKVMAPVDFFVCCGRVAAPTLIVHGEPHLDKVVPVEETKKYLALIPGSEIVKLPNTGHMGSLTRADLFADEVAQFVARAERSRGAGWTRSKGRLGGSKRGGI
jgi:pimeloyl-ACP methyl ester carboxylesterase